MSDQYLSSRAEGAAIFNLSPLVIARPKAAAIFKTLDSCHREPKARRSALKTQPNRTPLKMTKHKTITPLLTAIAMLAIPGLSHALRCGDDLANVGDLKQKVLLACGEPVSKEVIGYIDTEKEGDRIRVMKIEEWILYISDYYYSLVFEGNRLIKIENAGSKK